MASEIASDYAAHKKQMKSLTLDGVIETVIACDKATKILSNTEKFQLITQQKSENLYSVMRRLTLAFDEYKIGDPDDQKAKLRILKRRFCEAASLPESVRQSIRHCQDLDDVVACASEDMALLEQNKLVYNNQSHGGANHVPATQNLSQQRPFFQQKGKGGYKGSFQQQPQQVQWRQQQFSTSNKTFFQPQQPQQNVSFQHQQQPRPLMQQQPLLQQQQQPRPLMQQQQLHFAPSRQQQQFDLGLSSNHQGEINALSQQRVFTSPGSSVQRAPTNFEFQSENKQVMICLRCRVLSDHRGPSCPYFKFCSYCGAEGHSDYEHKNGLAKLETGQPQQLQQQQQMPQPQQSAQQQAPAQQSGR